MGGGTIWIVFLSSKFKFKEVCLKFKKIWNYWSRFGDDSNEYRQRELTPFEVLCFSSCFSFHMIILGPSFQKTLRQFKGIWTILSTFSFREAKILSLLFSLTLYSMCLFSTTLLSSK